MSPNLLLLTIYNLWKALFGNCIRNDNPIFKVNFGKGLAKSWAMWKSRVLDFEPFILTSSYEGYLPSGQVQ